MIKRDVTTLINTATQLLKADNTSIVSSKDIVNQLAWLLFLKYLEMSESQRHHLELFTLQREGQTWQYSWASWVNEMLRQGNSRFAESRSFLQEQFYPKLAELFDLKSEYFQVNANFVTFQSLLQLINETELVAKMDEGYVQLICETELVVKSDEDYIAQLYSALFALLTEENKKQGIFATPPAITRFMVQVLDPEPRDIVYDPACGTGDFLLATQRYCAQKNAALPPHNLYGRDSAEQIIQLARMNMLLHDINPKQVQQQEVERAFDQGLLNISNESLPNPSIMVMHPPLGHYPSRTKAKHPQESFDCYEAWFLQHSCRKMRSYPSYARCGMIVSLAFLDGREEQKVQMRKKFLQEWNILMIVWLPEIEFSPTTSPEKTFLLFFDKRLLTKKILHYNLALHLNHRTYTDTKPIQDTDFAEVLETWELWKNHLEQPEKVHEPAETEYLRIMAYDPQTFDRRLGHNPYSLLPLPPFEIPEEDQPTPDELLRQIEDNHLQQQKHIQRLRELLSPFSEEGDQA